MIDIQLFALPDSTITSLIRNDKWLYAYVRLLTEHNLLHKPYVRLRQENGEVKQLFLDKKDYDNIQALTLKLREDEMRISIVAQARPIQEDNATIFEAIQLLSVDKIMGKTYWEK